VFNASDFKYKEVINLTDGERLGFVYDLEIDLTSGNILKVIVPGRDKKSIFSKSKGLKIPWSSIKKIGDDIILVDLISNV
jgi:YlmC/YmxH family sporulation protein